jgi:hypothetical protein
MRYELASQLERRQFTMAGAISTTASFAFAQAIIYAAGEPRGIWCIFKLYRVQESLKEPSARHYIQYQTDRQEKHESANTIQSIELTDIHNAADDPGNN